MSMTIRKKHLSYMFDKVLNAPLFLMTFNKSLHSRVKYRMDTKRIKIEVILTKAFKGSIYGSKYSRTDQVKFVEDNL